MGKMGLMGVVGEMGKLEKEAAVVLEGAVFQEGFLKGKGKRVTGLTGDDCCCGLDVIKWGKDER
jgi:hypothetical protein